MHTYTYTVVPTDIHTYNRTALQTYMQTYLRTSHLTFYLGKYDIISINSSIRRPQLPPMVFRVFPAWPVLEYPMGSDKSEDMSADIPSDIASDT